MLSPLPHQNKKENKTKTCAENTRGDRGRLEKVVLRAAYEQTSNDQSFCQVGSMGRFCKYAVIDPAVCRELCPRLVPLPGLLLLPVLLLLQGDIFGIKV